MCWWLEEGLGPRRSRCNFLAMPQHVLNPWASYPCPGSQGYNRDSSKSLTPEDATDINNHKILCQLKPVHKKITAASSQKHGLTSCLEGSHFKPFVKCVRLLPGAMSTKNIILTSNHKVLLYILGVEKLFHRLLKIWKKKYPSLCARRVGGTKSVPCSLWSTLISV